MSTPPPPQQPPEQPPAEPPQPIGPYPGPQSPAPRNIYAQPTLVGQPLQPGGPQPPGPYGQPPYGPAPVPPPGGTGGTGGGGAGRAVLWAAAGALVASAAWAVGFFVIGDVGAGADLRGYSAPSNLCSSADYSSFQDEYPEDDTSPGRNSLQADALDESNCSLSLKKTGSSYADAYLTMQVDLHKKTDPGPEFTATWKNYRESHSGYDAESVEGLGDEAYLVSQDTTSGTSSGSLYATLAVRDGWTTYSMSYSVYTSTYDTDTDPPKLDEVADWLKTDSRSTLEKLRN